jgi:hypothetical protein
MRFHGRHVTAWIQVALIRILTLSVGLLSGASMVMSLRGVDCVYCVACLRYK